MRNAILIILSFCFFSCQPNREVDLILHNANFYAVDGEFNRFEAMAIAGGVIVDTGSDAYILKNYFSSQQEDLQTRFVYPGFNDGHAHFYAYASMQLQVDLIGTSSFEEVLQRVGLFAETRNPDFIQGRGWDQNDWSVDSFPDKSALDRLFPDLPVLLKRIDGHAALANQAALDYAGITPQTEVPGGLLVKRNGRLTGLLIDMAVDLVEFPEPSAHDMRRAILWAQDSLWKYGLTSVTEAGVKLEVIELYREMQREKELELRINAMVADEPELFDHFMEVGPIEEERLKVQCFKLYFDGALGSRGALMLDPYSDDSLNYGLMLHSESHFYQAARRLKRQGWQTAMHAIGDSANRSVLHLYEEVLADTNWDHRWRVEHAQIVHPADVPRFGKIGVIPSVQPTHATSDMYWVEKRLGAARMPEAYPYLDLWQSAGILVFGTDFPVEHINPLESFRAAVFRQDTAGYPPGGFRPDQRVNPIQALRSITYSPAYASFEEEVKGSLAPGKYADLVVLNKDLLHTTMEDFDHLKVIRTYVSGKLVYDAGAR